MFPDRISFAGQRYTGPTIRSVAGTNPAATGVEISETVPAATLWLLLAVRYTLTTDGNAGNRVSKIQFSDGTTAFWEGPPGTTQAANVTARIYSWGVGGVYQSNLSEVEGSALPFPVPLGPGYKFTTNTANKQATDDYSAPQYLVAEYKATG
jgi:hypothetical protein